MRPCVSVVTIIGLLSVNLFLYLPRFSTPHAVTQTAQPPLTPPTTSPPPPPPSCELCPCSLPEIPKKKGGLAFLNTFPEGVLTPTRPPVYVVTREPEGVLFALLQHELALLSHIRALTDAGVLRGQVLDVGCGCGTFSLYTARLGHSVAAFDSVPHLTDAVQQSAEINDVSLSVHNEFIFDQTTSTTLRGVGYAKTAKGLDEYVEGPIALLRVATHAHELFVLKSAEKAFADMMVQSVVLELTSHQGQRQKSASKVVASTAAAAYRYLVAKGFEAWLLRSPCLQHSGLTTTAEDLQLADDIDVQAHRLPHSEAERLLADLETNPHMRGMTCLFWFKHGTLKRRD